MEIDTGKLALKSVDGGDYVLIKRCIPDYCQVCTREFATFELVYFVPIDNNNVCEKCAIASRAIVEPRIHWE